MPLISFSASLRAVFLLLAAQVFTSCTSTPVPHETQELPALMVERLEWMDDVARAKQAKALPVTDAKREAELLDAMTRAGARHGLPSSAVRAFFAGQIDAAKQCQREWLAQHAGQPLAHGQDVPDLAATVRPALDAIGAKMLSALAAARRARDPAAIAIATAARLRLAQAGCSPAVIRPAVAGLEAALQ